MTKEQAINVLVQVAELAQSRGILKLNEAPVVFQAVSLLAPSEQPVPVSEPSKELPQNSVEDKVEKPKRQTAGK